MILAGVSFVSVLLALLDVRLPPLFQVVLSISPCFGDELADCLERLALKPGTMFQAFIE